jgi:F-box protein 9
MHYGFAASITWTPSVSLPSPLNNSRLELSQKYTTYLSMFHSRPRIRFGGCYISCINYTRHGELGGAHIANWDSSPMLIVTYYRYLRFYRDGTVISLLTTAEPADVVGVLNKDNIKDNGTSSTHNLGHGQDGVAGVGLPKVMREALRGRWRLTGNPFGVNSRQNRGSYLDNEQAEDESTEETMEDEGDLVIETEGVNEKYIFKMLLAFASVGRGTRNNKLARKGFWSYNKLTDDWAEFLLRNDRPYFWSRVRSYGSG